jgi:two-component system LytT family response regulator
VLTALLIDDEPLAHQVIMHHLAKHSDIKIQAQCYNATQAMAWLANHQVDLLILDINMPALSGLDMLKVLANRPQVIIISAYQEYAIEGFELDVTDYLLKPVSAERLSLALEKVRLRAQQHNMPATAPEHIVLKVDREKRKFTLAQIALLEAYGNYVKLWQQQDMTLVSCSLKQLIEQLPSEQFTQVHKSFVVNNSKVTCINTDSLTLNNDRVVKLGKSFKQQAKKLL